MMRMAKHYPDQQLKRRVMHWSLNLRVTRSGS
ncbi:hypothetical protein BJY24_001853 [Nocardia transvalensis]|uniref:Transposase n=1 Tax=Nocardia transvalensis TaxID=37333 RepID=A0A7W9PBC4_9NOCA|nr:hypothetical protein [Nocardia transvalensis]